MRETRKRSIVKAIVWRVIGVIMMMIISYALTQNVSISVELTIWTNLSSFILYYAHERGWNKIKWGTKEE
jgi:uncharacterized membrane protein